MTDLESKLIFSDEFSNTNELNYKVWDTAYAWGSNTIINNEQEYYVNVAKDGTSLSGGYNPFSVAHGVLTISAGPAPSGSSNGQRFDSGVITTQHSFSFHYGYAEIRAKLPAGAGTWPAFWMDQKNLVWPPELDIMEEIGQTPNQYVGSVHSGAANAMQQIYANTPKLSADFHTYGVDWEPDKITWYFDNKAVGQVVTPSDLHNPMYLLANLAIGGTWPGQTSELNPVPAQYKIDYIRVWDSKPLDSQDGATPISGGASVIDTLTLNFSEDAWQGDAQAIITIDGKTIGSTVTVTALHAQNKTQEVTLTGQWGAGVHDIGVQFINDAYGGSAATDRNLYVTGVSFDGQASATPATALWSKGSAHFATPATPLVLQLSEDAYLGDAQFTVTVDGKTLGPAQTVTTSHGSGATQEFGFAQAMTAGTHDVAVSFLNDAYGGSAATDRNLYVDAIYANGTAMAGTAATLQSTSTQHFSAVVPVH